MRVAEEFRNADTDPAQAYELGRHDVRRSIVAFLRSPDERDVGIERAVSFRHAADAIERKEDER